MWHELYMKKYLAGDKALMNWTDVMSQAKVDAYARDTWTRAKFTGNPTATPWRTTAEPQGTTLMDYTWSASAKDFTRPSAKSMFNEPMLVITTVQIDDDMQLLPDDLGIVAYYKGNGSSEEWSAGRNTSLTAAILLTLKQQAFMDGKEFIPDWVKKIDSEPAEK